MTLKVNTNMYKYEYTPEGLLYDGHEFGICCFTVDMNTRAVMKTQHVNDFAVQRLIFSSPSSFAEGQNCFILLQIGKEVQREAQTECVLTVCWIERL